MPYLVQVKTMLKNVEFEKRDKVATADYIKQMFASGMWGDNCTITITKK